MKLADVIIEALGDQNTLSPDASLISSGSTKEELQFGEAIKDIAFQNQI